MRCRFSGETRFEIAKELALQQGRIQNKESEKNPPKRSYFQENAKRLSENIEDLLETNDNKALEFISNVVKRETGCEIKAFCHALKALGCKENVLENSRHSDLFRDVIRKLVKILLEENIHLSLHVQSNLNRFMIELDRQLPETIFPKTSVKYVEEGRIRILRDYLRGYLRSN
jgi:uncharacterized membrane-anchored protein YjiN (DUF445 family)